MCHHLLIYNSLYGQTKKICDYFSARMNQEYAWQCQLKNIMDDELSDLSEFDSVLFFMPVRYGKHHPLMIKFIKEHQSRWQSCTTAVFSINLTARKPDKNTPETNPYLTKLLNTLNWKPTYSGVIAGALNYPSYTWYDRLMIQLIMKMTKGPTDKTQHTEFTDWDQVQKHLNNYASLFKERSG